MKKPAVLPLALSVLLLATVSSAQKVGIYFTESGTRYVIDGRSELVSNPDLGNLPSTVVYVIAFDIPELFGYEYNLTSSDTTAIASTPVIYPSTGSDFSSEPGDVRVNTGMCFHAGDAEAGSVSTQIRLAKHTYSWVSLPTVDVWFCIRPSIGSGATTPQYTACVENPVPLSCGVAPDYFDSCQPDGCIGVYFEWQADGVTLTHCLPGLLKTPSRSTSWGALKAAY